MLARFLEWRKTTVSSHSANSIAAQRPFVILLSAGRSMTVLQDRSLEPFFSTVLCSLKLQAVTLPHCHSVLHHRASADNVLYCIQCCSYHAIAL